ncbi:hypothetical protein SEA_NIOBE_57 [Arthrobacter phage Niobe]|uniref:Uncharacterized protein n=1 Tax=Arthrobacter phage Elezi TaxID=2762410 RepID=A0A7G8LH34_9CAUD|nr:hypothetical protein PQE13_gp56 [Arthrobacter phage Elezi]QNJ56556.1 hypothetical protein SEA_ELEZI_56 [Arthrobacter phage Elezi]QOP64360.1 hypothetical protein SEA_LONDON_57 [Arthrobacter phage London]UAJ15418.1 hypothetical protein SEA_ASA16_57 [Arthrobacter phage Asa16]
MAAERYHVVSEGFLPATAKLIRTCEGVVDAAVVAAGTPTDMRLLAAKLNAAEESLDRVKALIPEE